LNLGVMVSTLEGYLEVAVAHIRDALSPPLQFPPTRFSSDVMPHNIEMVYFSFIIGIGENMNTQAIIEQIDAEISKLQQAKRRRL
jgi:hypothetical protein